MLICYLHVIIKNLSKSGGRVVKPRPPFQQSSRRGCAERRGININKKTEQMKKGPQIRARAPSSSAPGGSEEKKKEPLKYKAMGNKRKPYERPDTTVVKVSEEHFLAGSFRGTLNPYGESTGNSSGSLPGYGESAGGSGSLSSYGESSGSGSSNLSGYGEGTGW